VYFGLLSILTQVGVAESEKRVAAIFPFPVSPLEPRKRSFRPYSGSYGCLMADRRPKVDVFEKMGFKIFGGVALFRVRPLGGSLPPPVPWRFWP